MVALILLLAGGGYYHYATDEVRLRSYAERWLADFTGGEVHIERVRFDPFQGLSLMGVTVATPASARFDPRDNSFEARTIFRSGGLFLRLAPFSVLTRRLIVPEVVAVDPELTLIHRMTDDARNWQVLLRRNQQRREGPPAQLPVIRLRNARLVHYRLDERGRSIGQAQVIWADAQPVKGVPSVYDLKVTRVFDAGSPVQDGTTSEAGRLRINLETLALSGSLPSISMDDLLFSAPARIVRWIESLAPRGLIRAEAIQFDTRGSNEARLSIREASFSVPIDAQEERLPAGQRYLAFSGMAGSVHLHGDRVDLDVSGRFRESPITLKGALMFGAAGVRSLEELGFELNLTLTGAPLPRNDEDTPPAERRFVQHWFHLREFVADYDARGTADFTARLIKRPGGQIQFGGGTLVPRGANARYFRFPYRLYEVGGQVHFRPDGRIALKDLSGIHGAGRATINGLLDGYLSQAVDVHVTAEGIALDDDLVRYLDPEDQDLIRQFDAQAIMDLDVRLKRGEAPHHTPREQNPWSARIDVLFKDGSTRFEDFPYPLEKLTGQMRIEGNGFTVPSLRALRGDAVVEVEGWAKRPTGLPAQLDLKLKATGVPLDEVLAAALPPEAKAVYTGIEPEGRFDLEGRIRTSKESGKPEYDVVARLTESKLTLPETKVRLEDVHAGLQVRPEELVVTDLHGRFGESILNLTARVSPLHNDGAVSVHLTSERLMLNESLRSALPETVQDAWRTFQLAGPIRLDLRADRAALGSRPAITTRHAEHSLMPPATQPSTRPEGQPAIGFTAAIEPLGCSATFEGFPLPLEEVKGRVLLTPQGAKIERLSGRHAEASLVVTGRVHAEGDATHGELKLQARGATFSEPLRQAVPWRVRRLWNDVKPRGRFDLTLDRLVFDTGLDGTNWDFTGTLGLQEAALSIGGELTEIDGQAHGHARFGAQTALDMDLKVRHMRLDGRAITDARAHMTQRPGETRLTLDELVGRFYDGTLTGEMEVNDAPGGSSYGLSLTARDVSLEKLLNAKRSPKEEPVRLRGEVEAHLDLMGRSGEPATRRGNGTVVIHEAQLLKVPLMLAILQVVHLAPGDDNAFHDARFAFTVDGEALLLDEIDLRGKGFSMVGSGTVQLADQALNLVLLIGSPLRLPRMEVLSELMEGVARELVEVHVEGTLEKPTYRAEVVRSVRQALDAVLNPRRGTSRR